MPELYGSSSGASDVSTPLEHNLVEVVPVDKEGVKRGAIVGMVLVAGAFAVVGATIRSPSALVGESAYSQLTRLDSPPSDGADANDLNFKAHNYYTRANGASGMGYSWVKPYKLVEPHRESTFEVCRCACACLNQCPRT